MVEIYPRPRRLHSTYHTKFYVFGTIKEIFNPFRYFLKNIELLGKEINMTKKTFAIAFVFFFSVVNMLRRRKRMQKSPVWKGFLTESLQIDDYRKLSPFNKVVFWVNYPVSYVRYLRVVVWDHFDRLSFI
jgi:hypothetical protein